MSTACAESVLLPAVRQADASTAVLADGFSCRTQIHELAGAGREALHVAELLRLQHTSDAQPFRPTRPQLPTAIRRSAALVCTAAAAGLASVGTGYAVRGLARRALRRLGRHR